MDLTPYLAAYGLQEANLSDERKRQLGNILLESAKTAGGTAVKEATRILQEEAAKRGIATGTTGSTASADAQKRIEELVRQEAEAEKAKRNRMYLIGGISAVILGIVTAVIIKFRKP